MITGKSIASLVIFVLSITFVIRPVEIPIRLPFVASSSPRKFRVNLTTAPIIAIAILWASQCLGPREIRDGIVGADGIKPYNILILFLSLAYMAVTLDVTGVFQSAAFWVSNRGGSNGYKLFFYFYLMLTALSVLLGNDAVILSATPFLVYYTKVAELNPTSWLLAEFLAGNTASMVFFVGNITNVVICEGFNINNAGFTAYTVVPFLGCIVAGFIALAFQFRDEKYIPRVLAGAKDLDVRSVLLDPFGALVGSVLLGACLVTIIIVSFFGIDVWKISLPFAVAKFIFDLAWDSYRYAKDMPMLGRKRTDPIAVIGQDAEEQVVLEELKKHTAQSGSEANAQRPAHGALGTLPSIDEDTSVDNTPSACRAASRARSPSNKLEEQAGDKLSCPKCLEKSPEIATTASVPAATSIDGEPANAILPLARSRSSDSSNKLEKSSLGRLRPRLVVLHHYFATHFPTLYIAFPRLPFALVPFSFSQFILIEGLTRQGWIDVFASWLSHASRLQIYPTVWLIGVLGVILCNFSGTNIGATILLTKVIRATPGLGHDAQIAGAIALAVASNIGAVSFAFSASLAGLLWQGILKQKGIYIQQKTFAMWNMLPLAAMTAVGLAVVCAEMAVLFPHVK